MGMKQFCVAILVLCALALAPFFAAGADDLPAGEDIAKLVAARDEGQTLTRMVTFEQIDKNGKKRAQDTKTYRKYFGKDKKSVIYFTAPKTIAGTAFLTYDYAEEGKDDDQWLYLPAMRKTRRISASDRGDYFLGTDLTYDDMKHETTLTVSDYLWTTVGTEEYDGALCYVVDVKPANEKIAKELGYSAGKMWLDQKINFRRKVDFTDLKGQPLKTVAFKDVREVDGFWTAHQLVAENLQTGHKTVLTFSDVKFNAEISDDVFTEQALARGL